MSNVRTCALSPDESLFIIGIGELGKSGKICIYDTENWDVKNMIKLENWPHELKFSHDGKMLAVCSGGDTNYMRHG